MNGLKRFVCYLSSLTNEYNNTLSDLDIVEMYRIVDFIQYEEKQKEKEEEQKQKEKVNEIERLLDILLDAKTKKVKTAITTDVTAHNYKTVTDLTDNVYKIRDKILNLIWDK